MLDLSVGAREKADGPIGAEHEAVRAKGLERDVEIRSEMLRLPKFPIGFRDEAGEFAKDVLILRERFDLRGPGFEALGFYFRLGEMVEDEALAGKAGSEFDGGGELAGIDEDVKGEAKLMEKGDAAKKIGAKEKAIVGFGLRDVAEAAELRLARKMVQPFFDARGLEIHPADDSGDAFVLRGELQEELGLVFGLADLNGDGGGHAVRMGFGGIFGGEEIALQGGHFGGDPGVARGKVMPKMLVSIEGDFRRRQEVFGHEFLGIKIMRLGEISQGAVGEGG